MSGPYGAILGKGEAFVSHALPQNKLKRHNLMHRRGVMLDAGKQNLRGTLGEQRGG